MAEQTDGGSVKRYLRGINLLAGEAEGMVYYYILNERGDVAQLWGQSGTCKALYEYDAFGNERNPEKGDENSFRYCGEYIDLETNTYYLRARYYNPTTGRFLSEDPARSGLNWYTYCNNNPIIFIDPSGLVAVGLKAYLETYKGATFSVGPRNVLTVSWNDLSFAFKVTEANYNQEFNDWIIDDSVFVNAFGIGDQKLLVYEDAMTGNVSIRAGFKISGNAANSDIDGTTYRALFLQGIEETWSGDGVSAYARERSKGIKVSIGNVNLNAKKDDSYMKRPLFGWSPSNPGSITMRTGNSRTGTIYTADQFKWVSAHEFGHILGVGDAYNSKNSTGVTSIFNEFGTGVQPGDIAKVLNAWSTKKWQSWP